MYPRNLNDLWLSNENKNILREFGNKRMNYLLLMEGCGGCGKTEASNQLANEMNFEIKIYLGSELRGQEAVRQYFMQECLSENVMTMLTQRQSLIIIEDFDQFYRCNHGERFIELARNNRLTKLCIGMYITTTNKKMIDLKSQFPYILFKSPTIQQLRNWFHISISNDILERSNGDIRYIYEKVLDQLPTEDKERDQTIQQLTTIMIRQYENLTLNHVLTYYDMGTAALQMSLYETIPSELWNGYKYKKNKNGFIQGYFQLLNHFIDADPFHNAIYSTMDPYMNDYVGLITCLGSINVMKQYNISKSSTPILYPNHLNRIAQIASNRNAIDKATTTFSTLNRLDVYYIPRLMYVEEWSSELIQLIQFIHNKYNMTKDQWEILLRGNRFIKDRDRTIIYRHMKRFINFI